MNFNRKQYRNRRSRGRQFSAREETVDLMQLMRERSRHRPYSIFNLNSTSAVENFPRLGTSNRRNIRRGRLHPFFANDSALHVASYQNLRNILRRREVYQDFTPLINVVGRSEYQEIGVNTEIPSVQVIQQVGNVHEFLTCGNSEVALEHNEVPSCENVNQLHNNDSKTSREFSATTSNEKLIRGRGNFNTENVVTISAVSQNNSITSTSRLDPLTLVLVNALDIPCAEPNNAFAESASASSNETVSSLAFMEDNCNVSTGNSSSNNDFKNDPDGRVLAPTDSSNSDDALNNSAVVQLEFIEFQSNTSILVEDDTSSSTISNDADGTSLSPVDTEAGGDGLHRGIVIEIELTLVNNHNRNSDDQNVGDQENNSEAAVNQST